MLRPARRIAGRAMHRTVRSRHHHRLRSLWRRIAKPSEGRPSHNRLGGHHWLRLGLGWLRLDDGGRCRRTGGPRGRLGGGLLHCGWLSRLCGHAGTSRWGYCTPGRKPQYQLFGPPRLSRPLRRLRANPPSLSLRDSHTVRLQSQIHRSLGHSQRSSSLRNAPTVLAE